MSVIISIDGYIIGCTYLTDDEIKDVEAQGFTVTMKGGDEE